ncbi:MAG: hypothetical protein K2H49_02220, partial [Muribaculaceae bacterium]|nr:hypothetical protein [Muribaculaceae bacterium]
VDLTEWKEIITGNLNMTKTGALQALNAANEEGEEFFFPFDPEETAEMIDQMSITIKLMAGNQAAYNEVIAKVDAVQKKYDEAIETLTKEYPDADLAEWKDIISGYINQAKSGAEQALEAANEDGEEFFFPFDSEEIEGMIEEMNNKVALEAANQAAYEEVIAQLDAIQKKYDDTVAQIKEMNPDFDFSESEMIGEYIQFYKDNAARALAAANEEGEEFFFPFSPEEFDAMIAMMLMDATPDPGFPETFTAKVSSENATVEVDNTQGVYTFVVSGVSAEKEVTVTVDVPEGWDGFVYMNTAEMEGGFGVDPLTRADDEYEDIWAPKEYMLYEDFKEGNTLTFPADDEEYSASLMLYKGDLVYVKNLVKIEFCVKYDATSGVAGVEAAENASYYDLQGNKISTPKAGMYVKVVDGKATKV